MYRKLHPPSWKLLLRTSASPSSTHPRSTMKNDAEGADMPVEGVGHIGMRQARDAQALALAFPALLLGIVDPQRIVAVKGDDRARALCGKVRGDPVFGGFRHGRTAMFMPHGCSGRELGYDRRR